MQAKAHCGAAGLQRHTPPRGMQHRMMGCSFFVMNMIDYRRKQTGGTLLGLIIGLIIGLGIAVVVAVTIKNTPLPFVDKMGTSGRAPASGKMSDPNKALYGNRDPAKEASKHFAKKTTANTAGDGSTGTDQAEQAKKPDGKSPAKAATKSAEAKTPLAEQPTDATAAVTKPAAEKSDEKYTYYLQAGAFLQKADAENTKAKLALLGFSANIAERESDNGTLYRVRIGPFSEQPIMNRMRGKLSDNGVDAAVVRVPK
jgi:cell division protein FtsN